MSDPGGSHRSIWKHQMLNGFLGKIAGVAVSLRREIWLYDLTAGDGAPNQWSGTSSLLLLHKHGTWLERRGFDVRYLFVERDRNTYDRLWTNINRLQWQRQSRGEVIQGDAGEIELPYPPAGATAFVCIDGNSINQNPDIRVLDGMPALTLLFSALGCNAHGVRGMLPRNPQALDRWRQQVAGPLERMRHWHDALMIEPKPDGHKWGYLIVSPTVWRTEVDRIVERAFLLDAIPAPDLFDPDRIIPYYRQAWYRTERDEFMDIYDSLLSDHVNPPRRRR